MTFNLAVMLTESARARPDHPVCHTLTRSMTYADLDRESAAVAAGLLGTDLRGGDRVAVHLPNGAEFLTVYFGLLRAGLVMVPVNPQLTAAELGHILGDSGARAIVTQPDCVPVVRDTAPTTAIHTADAIPTGEPLADLADTNADDTAVIVYTSGTTGRPKGARLSHFTLLQNATVAGDTFGVQPDDVSLAVLPFFHIYGLSGIVNVAVRFGTTLSVVPRFSIDEVLDAMARDRVSVLVGVPTMYHALLHADLAGRDLSALRVAASGGASMPDALMTAFEKRFGVVVLEGYGLSETGSAAMLSPSAAQRRIGSVGKPIWGVSARLVDAAGRQVGPGANQIGEIQLHGHIVMSGYHNDPTATVDAIRDGWLRTGDLAYRDCDGFYYLVDRLKDLIIRGGYNVYPREVEEVLYAHPGIGEAAVIGRPDDRLGEEIVGVVAAKPGATLDPDEIIAYCRQRLAAYKCPRQVLILPELPKTPTGKPLKRELRAVLENNHA